MRRSIILIGPPASGKSSVGKRISKMCGAVFFDLDRMIEEKSSLNMGLIFKNHGEAYFRLLETRCLEDFYQREKPLSYVFSAGGGTPILQGNRDILKALGTVVYLKAPFDKILSRISQRGLRYPLFYRESQKKLRILLNEREKYYIASADFMIDTEKKSIMEIGNEILKRKLGGETHGER